MARTTGKDLRDVSNKVSVRSLFSLPRLCLTKLNQLKSSQLLLLVLTIGFFWSLLLFYLFTCFWSNYDLRTKFLGPVDAWDSGSRLQRAEPVAYIVDMDVGLKLKPYTKIHYREPGLIDSTVVTNRDGFTGRDYPLETKMFRIALMGDSILEGYGVPDAARIPAMIEFYVPNMSKGKKEVEVMGFAASGWGQVNHLGCLKKYVLKYHPDEIWTTFAPDKDFGVNSPFKNSGGGFFVYEDAAKTKLKEVKYGYQLPPMIQEAEVAREFGGKEFLANVPRDWDSAVLPNIAMAHPSALWQQIEEQTWQAFRALKKVADENHIKLRVVYRPSDYENTNKDRVKWLTDKASDYMGKQVTLDPSLVKAHIMKKFAELGIPVVDMSSYENHAADPAHYELAKHDGIARILAQYAVDNIDLHKKKRTDA